MTAYYLMQEAAEIMAHAMDTATVEDTYAAFTWAKNVSENPICSESLRLRTRAMLPMLRGHLKEYELDD